MLRAPRRPSRPELRRRQKGRGGEGRERRKTGGRREKRSAAAMGKNGGRGAGWKGAATQRKKEPGMERNAEGRWPQGGAALRTGGSASPAGERGTPKGCCAAVPPRPPPFLPPHTVTCPSGRCSSTGPLRPSPAAPARVPAGLRWGRGGGGGGEGEAARAALLRQRLGPGRRLGRSDGAGRGC